MKWTAKDDIKLIDEVKNSPDNLRHAFRKYAAKTNRTFLAAQARYYTITKDDDVNVAFHLLSDRKILRNRKVRKYND